MNTSYRNYMNWVFAILVTSCAVRPGVLGLRLHSLKVNNAIYNANCATMPDVQLFLLINYFLKTKPGKVQNWHRVKQCHFARRLMYIKSNTVIHIQSDHSGWHPVNILTTTNNQKHHHYIYGIVYQICQNTCCNWQILGFAQLTLLTIPKVPTHMLNCK